MLKPKHFDALHMLGVLAIQTHRPHDAVALIAQAVAQNPRIAIAHRNFAIALLDSGLKQEAVECYERAILLEPQYGGTYVQVAGLLVELGDARRALAWCDWGMQYHPNDPFLHLARAVALRALGRLRRHWIAVTGPSFISPAARKPGISGELRFRISGGHWNR